MDRGVDRRPGKSHRHVCVRGTPREASLLVKHTLRLSVLLLIRRFGIDSLAAPGDAVVRRGRPGGYGAAKGRGR